MSDLKNLKRIKSIDIDEFDGKDAKIEDVIIEDPSTKDFGEGAKEVRQIKIITNNLSTDDKLEIRATEYVAMKKDLETGEWGIPDGSNSKAMQVLNFFGVKDFEAVIGQKCRVVKRVKGDKSYLGIHLG